MTPKLRLILALTASGALVGTLIAAPVTENGRRFVKTLTGQAELDGGRLTADLDGTGTAHVTVNVGQERVCWDLQNLANLDTLIASHIHQAAANAQGPIRISFFNFGEPIDLQGCTEVPGTTAVPFNRARLEDIMQHPENYYVNVHTSAFTGGAIRGQLSRGRQD